MHYSRKRHAFSLVELSIVLVILGLLVGGVLSGQSLIRAAELRSVSSEYQRYQAAIQSFRDKYFALPGDMTNATSFWGDQATGTAACASGATPDGTPGTCNGDGNGFVGDGATTTGEGLRGWQHLALAGLIEGSFSGSLTGGTTIEVGVNLPRARLGNAVGWELLYRDTQTLNRIYGASSNFLLLGQRGGFTMDIWAPVIKPEEAWNIDTKMDDGRPGLGAVMAGSDSTLCVTPNSIDYDAAGAANTNAAYNLTATGNECRMWFKY